MNGILRDAPSCGCRTHSVMQMELTSFIRVPARCPDCLPPVVKAGGEHLAAQALRTGPSSPQVHPRRSLPLGLSSGPGGRVAVPTARLPAASSGSCASLQLLSSGASCPKRKLSSWGVSLPARATGPRAMEQCSSPRGIRLPQAARVPTGLFCLRGPVPGGGLGRLRGQEQPPHRGNPLTVASFLLKIWNLTLPPFHAPSLPRVTGPRESATAWA